MATVDKEASRATNTAPHSKRELFKGTLKPPSTKPTGKSYTLAPASIAEVVVRDPAAQATRCPQTAISSMAVPQPFVDPAVLQRRPNSP
ncbi:hypothetical protein F4808DRAFT_260284 [Astrocystis sublimbata]|nr:hypothetical protein F4808DRAFT_264602 [Astrocystis sublimbata]KAI0198337.1 hypothetical protein F4808DRAFT_260284 [Astrocystis sublimbata]